MIYQDTTKPVTIPFCHKMGKEPNVNGICVAEDSYNELINSDEVKELYQTDKLKLQSLQEELNKAEENNEKFQTFNNLDKLIDKKYREMTFEKYLG